MGAVGLAVVLLVLGAVVPGTAHAQFRMGMFNIDSPDITSEELNRYASLLGLDAGQKEAASAMLDAYLAEFTIVRNEWQRIRDGARREFNESRDPAVWQELQGVMAGIQEKKSKLEATFLDDYRLLLTPEQDARWEDLERLRRRERTLPNGGLVSGETVDLVRVVNDLPLSSDGREIVGPLLDSYARELDRVLIERNRIYEAGMSRGMQLWQNMDFDTMNRLLEEGTTHANRVREVHRRFVRQIEAALPEPDRGRVEAAFDREAYPQIYRDSVAESSIRMALEFSDLTDEQRREIRDILERHDREVVALNNRWRTAVDRSESNRSVMDFMGGGGRDPEMRIARQARRDFDLRIVNQVRELLNEEQRARLPAADTRPDWRQGPEFGEGEMRGNRGNWRGPGGGGGPGREGGPRGPRGPRGPQRPDA